MVIEVTPETKEWTPEMIATAHSFMDLEDKLEEAISEAILIGANGRHVSEAGAREISMLIADVQRHKMATSTTKPLHRLGGQIQLSHQRTAHHQMDGEF